MEYVQYEWCDMSDGDCRESENHVSTSYAPILVLEGVLVRYTASPTDGHWQLSLGVLSYLSHTRRLGITLGEGEPTKGTTLTCYSVPIRPVVKTLGDSRRATLLTSAARLSVGAHVDNAPRLLQLWKSSTSPRRKQPVRSCGFAVSLRKSTSRSPVPQRSSSIIKQQ